MRHHTVAATAHAAALPALGGIGCRDRGLIEDAEAHRPRRFRMVAAGPHRAEHVVDAFVANSGYIAERIRKVWRREALVLAGAQGETLDLATHRVQRGGTDRIVTTAPDVTDGAPDGAAAVAGRAGREGRRSSGRGWTRNPGR